MYFSPLPSFYKSYPSRPWFDHPNNIRLEVQITKLFSLIKQITKLNVHCRTPEDSRFQARYTFLSFSLSLILSLGFHSSLFPSILTFSVSYWQFLLPVSCSRHNIRHSFLNTSTLHFSHVVSFVLLTATRMQAMLIFLRFYPTTYLAQTSKAATWFPDSSNPRDTHSEMSHRLNKTKKCLEGRLNQWPLAPSVRESIHFHNAGCRDSLWSTHYLSNSNVFHSQPVPTDNCFPIQ
jgi:hypothetical protein